MMHDHYYDDTIHCPHCNAQQYPGDAYIGDLGSRMHYRCRYCGGMWSESDEEINDEQ